MRRFKKILAVYADKIGADDVFGHATELASSNGAHLTIIETLPEKYTTSKDVSERRKHLNRLIPAFKAEGVADVSVEVVVGQPYLQIVRQVINGDHDLVIASADGETTLRNFYFGSTATHLMRKCPCPVWIVKPDRVITYSKILACIDPDSDADNDRELDTKILDLATSLAQTNNAELHVVHAWDVEGRDRDMITSEIPDKTRAEILKRHEAKHCDCVEQLMDAYDLSDIKLQVHLPRKMPQKAIVGLVDDLDIDLIVMGTVSRGGISGMIIGNAAESILSVVKCSVLTVKPRSFITPVTASRRSKVA